MSARVHPEIKPGQRYGRLLVLQKAEASSRQPKWECLCDCGNRTAPFQFSLNTGKAKSCGCIAAEKSKTRWANATPEMFAERVLNAPNRTHGMSKHGAFRSWSDMKSRCLNKDHKWYPTYGGRGITVDAEWLSFEKFWEDLGDTWFQGAQIGRLDNNGNYEPSNVRWETPAQQQSNKSNNVFICTPSGRMTLSQAARNFNIDRGCLAYRLRVGYPESQLFKPSQRAKQ